MHKPVAFVCLRLLPGILPGLLLASLLVVPDTGSAAAAQPVPSRSALTAPTVSAFLAACITDKNGCTAAIGNALINKVNFSAGTRVCISSTDYAQGVPEWLSAHPETAQMPADDGIYLALKALYPCS